jgi:hypothetical protein
MVVSLSQTAPGRQQAASQYRARCNFKIIHANVMFLLQRAPHTTGFSFKWKIEFCNTVYGNAICIAPGCPCMGNNKRVNLANNPVWLQSSHTSCGNFIHATKYHKY